MRNQRFSIDRPSIINLVHEESFQEVSICLTNDSYRKYILDGEDIFDAESFLKEFSEQILKKGAANNLSNFEDLFFDLLINNDEKRTVFIWTNVDNMLNGGLEALLIFSDILCTITRKLYQHGRVHINVFFGNDCNFLIPIQL